MRAVVVVVVARCRNRNAGTVKAREKVLVHALVPEASIDALHEAVLHRFSWTDGVCHELRVSILVYAV